MSATFLIKPKTLPRRIALAGLIIIGAVIMIFTGEMILEAEAET